MQNSVATNKNIATRFFLNKIKWFYDVYNAICVFDMTFLLHIYLHATALTLLPTNFLFKQTNNKTFKAQ